MRPHLPAEPCTEAHLDPEFTTVTLHIQDDRLGSHLDALDIDPAFNTHLLHALDITLYLFFSIALLSWRSSLLTLTPSSLNKLRVCIVFVALRIQKLKANITEQIFASATPPFSFVNIMAMLLLGCFSSCRWRWRKRQQKSAANYTRPVGLQSTNIYYSCSSKMLFYPAQCHLPAF